MTATATLLPPYPIPNRAVRITLSSDVTSVNLLRLFVTDAPDGSSYKAKIDAADGNPVQVVEVPDGNTWVAKDFDVGGVYTFSADEVVQGATTHGGGWHLSPDGDLTETISNTTTLSIYIGTRLEMELGARADTATLAFYVWNATIRATERPDFPEKTPAIFGPTSNKAAIAKDATTVTSAVDALASVAASVALGNIGTRAGELVTDFNAHRTQGSVHAVNDTDNTISTAFGSPATLAQYAETLNEVRAKLVRHIQNDNGTDGVASQTYHTRVGKHLPIAPAANADDPGSILRLLADIHRSYEAHRADATVHSAADSTNTLTALDELPAVHSAFFAVIAQDSPTAPSTEHSAASLLISSAGMEKA